MALTDFIPGGKMIDSFLNPEAGYEDAAKQMQRSWKEAQGFQKPYQQAGVNQIGTLTGAQGALLNPSDLLANWMNKYETSPYAQRSMENAKASGLDAASSMGLLGSSAALGNIEQSASDIMNADRSQFLNDLMNKYMAGIGIGQNMFNVGASTAANMGQQGIGVGENLGAAAYGAKAAPGEMFKNLLALGAKGLMAA